MRRTGSPGREEGRLVVDPTRCTGVGMCAHVAGTLVDLDVWGYPVVPGRDLDGAERRAARVAVRACPRRALALGPGQASGAPPVTPST